MQSMDSLPRQYRRRIHREYEAILCDASLAASSRQQHHRGTSSCCNRRTRCSTTGAAAAAAAIALTLLSCPRHIGGASAFIVNLPCYPFTTKTSASTKTAPTQRGRAHPTMSVLPPLNNDILRTAAGSLDTHTAPTLPPKGALSTTTHQQQLPELNHDEVRRYSRHLILPDVGVRGQRTLKASSVLAVGTGGLGSPALLYLAAAGVGRLGVLDDDVVDESNLQRQVIHGTSTLGKPKVESARDRMLDVNPHVEVETFEEKLTSENALRILDGYDVVLDGSDNFPTKYLVSDACEILEIPNVYGAILGFEGQMSVFSYKGGPSYRDLMPTPPPPGLVPSCAEGGVLGILPGVVGCIQATEVIKILLGKGDVLSGRLLVYDALAMTFKESTLAKIPGRPPVNGLVDYQGFCGFSSAPPPPPPPPPPPTVAQAAAVAVGRLPDSLNELGGSQGDASEGSEEDFEEGFERISPQDIVTRMEGGWTPYVLDVRLPQEAEIASLPFVDKVCPHRKVVSILGQLPDDEDLLVHCKVGGRSAKACATLREHGIPRSRLFNMEGGIIRWAKEIDSSLAVY